MSCDCVLIGRLTKDCERKSTKNGKLIVCLTVASNRGFGDKQETDYIDCIAFHPLLENQVVHLLKGCMVKIVGHMQSRKSEAGIVYWNMIVESLEMLWGKKTKPQDKPTGGPENFSDDDIPF